MSVEAGLFAYLSTKAAITAVISTRVYSMTLPQPPIYPAITYQRISGMRVHSLLGASQLEHPRMQITAWGRTYKAAKDLAELVRLAMDGYSGTMGTTEVQASQLMGEKDTFVFQALHDLQRVYGASQDWMIWAAETAPTL